jgi:uncharacterized protein
MSNVGRMALFVTVVLGVWGLMHAYAFFRLWTIPILSTPTARRWLISAAIAGWIGFPLVQFLSRSAGRLLFPFEILTSVWVGVLFLLIVCLLVADVVTGFGWLMPRLASSARSAAVLCAAVFSLVALVQGLRPPVVRDYSVVAPTLRPELDGLVVVQISDLHLGPTLGGRWLERRIDQVDALHPDLVVVTGDILDADAGLSEPLVPVLRRLKAPLGVWGVTGNHDVYAGLERSLRICESAGIRMLRDTSAEIAPGLVLAGVDDLTARAQYGLPDDAVDKALGNRPPGTTIFLCHSPWQVERASELGANLMLSGHTHAGQIWPFTYIVGLTYPYVVGRFEVGRMTLLVSRGTGFWGPPMRLFRPGEILRVVLKRGAD